MGPQQERGPLKVYRKNPTANPDRTKVTPHEARPDDQRDAQEFIEMGGKGDQELFADDADSFYSKDDKEAATSIKDTAKGKENGK